MSKLWAGDRATRLPPESSEFLSVAMGICRLRVHALTSQPKTGVAGVSGLGWVLHGLRVGRYCIDQSAKPYLP